MKLKLVMQPYLNPTRSNIKFGKPPPPPPPQHPWDELGKEESLNVQNFLKQEIDFKNKIGHH
jgi:hypothetical protein